MLAAVPVTVLGNANPVEGDEEMIVASNEILRGRLKNSQTLKHLGVLVDHLVHDKVTS